MLNNTTIKPTVDIGSQKIGMFGTVRDWIYVIGIVGCVVYFGTKINDTPAQISTHETNIRDHEARIIRLETSDVYYMQTLNEVREDIKLIKKAVIK